MSELTDLDKLYFRAMELSDSDDFEASLPMFLQLALQGYGAAQNALGNAYCAGQGVDKNEKIGIEWYKKAYRTDPQLYCLSNIALAYANMGKRSRAIHWWRKAVALGYGSAAMALALYLMKSDEVLELVEFAANCEGNWQITPLGKEEAEDLLAILTRANWD